MIYDLLVKNKIKLNRPDELVNEFRGSNNLISTDEIWVHETYKVFSNKHYTDMFDDVFTGFYYKIVYRKEPFDYRINLHCDVREFRYLVSYYNYEAILIYDFRKPNKIKVQGHEFDLGKTNDVLFNLEISLPFIMKDFHSLVQNI